MSKNEAASHFQCYIWMKYVVVLFLLGGFNKFQSEYSEHCETSLDTSCPSSSPPMPVLGLGGLRISSDFSDGESDREPSSATESEGSPLPSNQPAFPVQILPYLYLGCAKDSTNLDVLSKYDIKYILNVTPNLPNMFEHDGEFKYKQIPISDHWSQNLSQFFPEAISFIGKWPVILLERCIYLDFLSALMCLHFGLFSFFHFLPYTSACSQKASHSCTVLHKTLSSLKNQYNLNYSAWVGNWA